MPNQDLPVAEQIQRGIRRAGLLNKIPGPNSLTRDDPPPAQRPQRSFFSAFRLCQTPRRYLPCPVREAGWRRL